MLIGSYIFIEVQYSNAVKAHLCSETSGFDVCMCSLCYQEVIKVIQPVLLGKLIEYFESYDPANSAAVCEAYIYAAGISLSTISLAVLHHLYFYHVQRAGMKIRVAMCHMIYRKVTRYTSVIKRCPLNSAVLKSNSYLCRPKALCLNNSALAKTTTGQIVNLLSNDINKFDEVSLNPLFLKAFRI